MYQGFDHCFFYFFIDVTVQIGATFWNDSTCAEKCMCTHAGLQCQPALLFFPNLSTECISCQTVPKRTCTISGDPHYYTFDGTVFHFQGTCTYIISEVELNSSLPYYRVEAKNENRGSTRVSWTELVKVFVYNYTIELVKGQQGKAKVSNFDSGYNSIEVLMQAIVYTMHKHILP